MKNMYLAIKIEKTECSEMSAYKIETLGNYPEESTQHAEHGKSLKSRGQKLDLISANPDMCTTKTAHI